MFDFSKSYFSLFGLPEGFELDRQALDERYRELQRVLHPDRFASASDQERRMSMQQATRVNEAYKTLKQPLSRGSYLLQLRGLDAAAVAGNTHDTLFLMEQMELRELLESARSAKDPFEVTGRVLDEVTRRSRELTADLARCFAEASAESLESAADLLRKMQFLQKLGRDAEALEADLEENL